MTFWDYTLNQGQAGYEAYNGRVAAYHLGYLMHTREQDLVRAADYYSRCLVFSETVQLTSGYYVFANAALARLVTQHQDVAAACRYYEMVVEKADKHEACYRNALAYLSHYRPLKHPL